MQPNVDDPLCWYCYDEYENCAIQEPNAMTTAEAQSYLRDRIALMNKRAAREYPKWSISDFVAVQILLQELMQRQPVTTPE